MTERAERWARGLASLALLVGLLVGVPAALLALGGNPLPTRWDLADLGRALLRPDDGTVLARLLALVGWAAWAVFALTLVIELVNLVRRRSRSVVLPGLGGLQHWAAGLMLTVVALGAAAQVSAGPPASTGAVARAAPVDETPPAPPPAPPGADPTSAPARAGEPAEVTVPLPGPHAEQRRIHVVQVGDDLWSLAEHYYGRGQEWRRIAAANPERLTGGPDRLQVGWRLVVPDDDRSAGPEEGVRVRHGETLSSIAARTLGDARRWPELFRANRDQLSDPDALPVGLVLRLPGGSRSATSDRPTSPDRPTAPGPATRPFPHETPAPTVPDPAVPDPAPPEPATTAPTAPVPSPVATSVPAAVQEASEDDAGPSVLVPGLATVGGLLAAALLGGLAARRRWQLQRRAPGRRIAHPPPATRPVEVELARRSRPVGLRTLDRASRALAARCREAGVPVPGLASASVSEQWLVLELDGPTPPAPRCFVDTGGTWCLSAGEADALRLVPGLGEAVRPWPLLVTLGRDEEGAERVVDLESRGLVAVEGDDLEVTGFLAALALELGCSPWTDDLRLLLVRDERLAPALAQHNVSTEPDLDALLERWDALARERERHAGGLAARDLRQDVDRAEAWTPEVLVVDSSLSPAQLERLVGLTAVESGVGLSAVVRGPLPSVRTRLVLDGGQATLGPDDVRLTPQTLPDAGLDPVVALVSATGSDQTSAAPWWSASEPPEPPPDNVTYLGLRRRDERDEAERRAVVRARMTDAVEGTTRQPLLRLIGPVDLLGAHGTPPTRAARQCLEYCAWLMEHPGATAQDMAAGLLVAEGTRRSNMSRLRSWLGDDPDGRPYLPEAYSGRIRLDVAVSSDWHELRLLLGEGVDQAPSDMLELGLRLVRGAPLADASPLQWHWAEELRTDIVSCIRDMGVELANRSIEQRNLDLARWSASRALVVAPGDELLLAARIRVEHLAGNTAETERLCLQLAQQSRTLGVDLDPVTVDLLQEVMEGRVRTRLA